MSEMTREQVNTALAWVGINSGPYHEVLRTYIAQLEQRNAELEGEKTKWVRHAAFYHRWATRTNVTDGERLSVIKHYPLTDEEIEAALAATKGG